MTPFVVWVRLFIYFILLVLFKVFLFFNVHYHFMYITVSPADMYM